MDMCVLLRNTPPKVPKITVIVDDVEFERLDSYCRERGFKKSSLIARLIREYLDREGFHVQAHLPLERPTGRPGSGSQA
jgi:hypothetical protein